MIKASGNQVEVYYPGIFAKGLQGENIETLLNTLGSAPAASAAPAAKAAEAKPVAEEKKEEKKEEEEVDMGGVGDIFGGDDD